MQKKDHIIILLSVSGKKREGQRKPERRAKWNAVLTKCGNQIRVSYFLPLK